MDNFTIESAAVESLKITWTVPQCLSLPDAPDYSLDSSPFLFANATWCLRLYPNDKLGVFVSLARLHSLVWMHEITCSFRTRTEDRDCPVHGEAYSKLRYNEDFREIKYYVRETLNRPESNIEKKICTPDGTLVLLCHLLSEEVANEDQHLQKCGMDCSNIYKRRGMQKNLSNLSLMSSEARSLKIQWSIPNFFSLPETTAYSLNSPSFDFGYATWFLKLYPNGKGDNSSIIFSLVRSHSLIPLRHKVVCNFDKKHWNRIHFGIEYSEFSFNENRELEDSYLDLGDRIIVVEEVAAPDGNVTFFCHFFYEEATLKDTVIHKMMHELDIYRTSSEDFKGLLLNGKDYDLTLKIKDKEFRVHRNILSARSEVFASMLTHNMREKNDGIINIPDCDPEAMEQFLLYVYSSKMTSLNEANMLGLYYAADKYNMVYLKQECRDFIQKSLSCHNVCAILLLAIKHSDEDLIKSTTEYFVNSADVILSTPEWISFKEEHEDIANELLNKKNAVSC